MSANPLVSIITPSYNQAAYLEHTLQSVLNQDYSPIEYLVIDGASTDGSTEIIRRYADRLAWWVSEPDAGQAEALNKGFQRAHGEIIAWVNSDDLLLPGAVREAVAALQARPELGMVFGDALTVDSDGRLLNRLAFDDWGLKEFICFRIICQPAVFMRTGVLRKAGLLEPTYHFMLDHHLWVRLASLAPVHYARGNLWAAARHHSGAKNIAQAAAFSKEILRLMEWLLNKPELALLTSQNRQQVIGGAYRLSGRYLLDGNLPVEALRCYLHALRAWPGFAIKHWPRIVYALMCTVGLHRLVTPVRARRDARRRSRLETELRKSNLTHWPGLQWSSQPG